MTLVAPLIFKSYLAVIENSPGTAMFRQFYALVEGIEQEIMRNGDLSCAFFASTVLAMFRLIERGHGTVAGTIRDLEKAGWVTVEAPRRGAVVLWEAKVDERGESHQHIGFAVSDSEAISNSSADRSPARHPINTRPVQAIYWLPGLETR
jgi:hypothetical protein